MDAIPKSPIPAPPPAGPKTTAAVPSPTAATVALPSSSLMDMGVTSKKKTLSKNGKINIALKYSSLLIVTICITSLISFMAVLHPENGILKLFGVTENTITKNKTLTEKDEELTLKNIELGSLNGLIKKQIESNNFYIHADKIGTIQEKQRFWEDQLVDGEIHFGLLDLTDNLTQYINDGNYDLGLLYKQGSVINIKNLSIERNKATFTIYASNFFGNVFLLASEFTKVINGLPNFKNGEILNYSRVKERSGVDAMSFSLTVETQYKSDIDTDDNSEGVNDFITWYKENNEMYAAANDFDSFSDTSDSSKTNTSSIKTKRIQTKNKPKPSN